MDQSARLAAAPQWLQTFSGKDPVRGYHKYFGVDRPTAVRELKLLGVPIDPNYLSAFNQRVARQRKARALKRKRERDAAKEPARDDQDERFAFIAGHTSGGAPYGLTHEELGEEPFNDQKE